MYPKVVADHSLVGEFLKSETLWWGLVLPASSSETQCRPPRMGPGGPGREGGTGGPAVGAAR